MPHLTDPFPRAAPLNEPCFVWPTRCSVACGLISPPPDRAFSRVLEERRSVRSMSPLVLREVVNTVAYATLPRFRQERNSGLRTRRPAVSAGALHPLSIVAITGQRNPRAFRYDCLAHRLELLDAKRSILEDMQGQAASVLPHAHATLLVFIAEAGRTQQWYTNSDSLVWRDAGALLQTLALTATAFGQAFCPIGLLGNSLVGALGGHPHLKATGAALIGQPRR